jgi:hypothetical protein
VAGLTVGQRVRAVWADGDALAELLAVNREAGGDGG